MYNKTEHRFEHLSPSHALGLEPAKFDEPIYFDLETESPSHTVGLELSLSLSDGDYRLVVSIPYGRLKTSPKKLENQSLNPLKIETAHREGTLTHIQLPS